MLTEDLYNTKHQKKVINTIAIIAILLIVIIGVGSMIISSAADDIGTWNFNNSKFKKFTSITSSQEIDGLTFNATQQNNMIMAPCKTKIDSVTYKRCLKLNGAGSSTYRSVSFEVSNNSSIEIVLKSNGKEDRTLILADENCKQVTTFAAKVAGSKVTYDCSNLSGKVYLYSANSGVNIYMINLIKKTSNDVSNEKPTFIPTGQPEETVSPINTTKPIETSKPQYTVTPTNNDKIDYVNPAEYESKTTVAVLNANVVDISTHTAEFQGLAKDCTKVAYAYADPRENADASRNNNNSGAKSFAAYIFGYNNTTDYEFLEAKKAVTYVLNKLYFDSGLRSNWYKQLVGTHGIYIILEKPGSIQGCAGVKFGNPKDGFGMRLCEGCMKQSYGRKVLYHEMSHSIWDVGVNINNFNFGTDPRTGINYGTGNFIEKFTKLYNDSIAKNQFYSGSYGWNYVHENYAESASLFFNASWRDSLKKNDPIVYNILKQIYTEF